MQRFASALAAVLATLALPPLEAEASEQPRIHALRVQEIPTIDGAIDEPVWLRAEPASAFTQVEPVEGAPPSFRSELRVLTDDESLFIAFRAYDPEPDRIAANLMGRDDSFTYDDSVTLVFDTFHDHRNGFYVQVNAVGGRRDGSFEANSFTDNWDGIWFAEARIDQLGWTAEIRIPFRTFSIAPGGDAWGFNAMRKIARLNEEVRWADPIQARPLLSMGHAGVLDGLAGARQGLGLDVVPALTFGGYSDEVENDGDLIKEPSLDAFYRVLPSLTASLTVNTDFAGTEVDNQETNFSRFALFFPEKRDFFLQDGGLFDFGGLSDRNADGALADQNGIPFFSRRIGLAEDGDEVRLWGGAKLAGRVGPVNLGVLNIQQDRSRTSESTNLTVARLSANLFEESTAGILLTHGDPLTDDKNGLVGADFNYRSSNLIEERVLRGNLWFQNSFSGEDDYDREAHAWGAKLGYPNDIVRWEVAFRELDEDFDPALGFVNRPDIRQLDLDWRYRIRPPRSRLRTIDTRVVFRAVLDREDDTLESWNVDFRLLKLTNQHDDSIELIFHHFFEYVEEVFYLVPHAGIRTGRYNAPSAIINLATSRNRPLRFSLGGGGGGFLDGQVVRWSAFAEWRPSPHLLVSLDWVERYWRSFRAHKGGLGMEVRSVDFETRTVRARLRLNFTPNVSWSNFVQYDNVSNRASLQSIFRWIVREGNDIFIVVGQDADASPHDLRAGRTDAVARIGWTFRF